MDDDSNDILRPLFSVLLANHSLLSNEEFGINPSNYRNRNAFLAWDLSQMPPGQSFEMTQEKPLSLILKLRRANNFAPREVNKNNEAWVHELQYGEYLRQQKVKHKYSVGDHVRKAINKGAFSKSYKFKNCYSLL